MPCGMESVVRRHRHSQFEAASIGPSDRRREVIAILARGLTRVDRASKEDSRIWQNRPCFPGEDAAQCDLNAPGQPADEFHEVAQ